MTKTKKPSAKKFEKKPISIDKDVKPTFKKTKRGRRAKHRSNNNKGSMKLYQAIAKVLDNMKDGEISFKDAFFQSNIEPELKTAVYAVTSKIVNNWKLLNQIVEESGILVENPGEDKNTIKAIINDYLWGCKKIVGKEWVFDIVRGKKEELSVLKEKFGDVQNKKRTTDLTFVKINPIKYNVDSFKKFLEELNFQSIKTPKNYENFIDILSNLKSKLNRYMIDYHFKDLFIFPSSAKSKICENEIFQKKFITFQDKSSLIPVSLLKVEPGSRVLDMCAAPGMKTVYLASQLKGTGEVLAVDRDKKRYQTLIHLVKSFGASKLVKTHHNDITKFECDEESIDFVLLDAPCSGSGIRDRLGETQGSKDRLRSLQWLQHKMLTQALTKYTNAKRIVYSTCSKFTEENEAVIDMTLKKLGDDLRFKLVDCHELIKGFAKGSSEFEFGSLCLKVDTEKDHSNGFFTAVFENVDEEITKSKKMPKKSKIGKNKISKDESEGEDTEEEESENENSEGVNSEDENSDGIESENENSDAKESGDEDSDANVAVNSEEEESDNQKSEEENPDAISSEDENSDESEGLESHNVKNIGAKSIKRKAVVKTKFAVVSSKAKKFKQGKRK